MNYYIEKCKKNCSGFTLVEMIVVVAILGVLAAISAPMFKSQIQKTQEAVCLNNRNVLKREILCAIFTDEMSAEDAFEKYKSDADCVSNGTISFYFDEEPKEINIYCSVHTDSGSGNLGSISNAIDLLKKASSFAVDNFTSLESLSKKASATRDLQSSTGVVALSADELKKVQSIGSSRDFSGYFWIPTYSSSGKVIMVATNQTGKSNPSGSLIYYNNNYYYYYYVNQFQKIGVTYITDNGFDEKKLNPNVTTPIANNTWIKIQ